MLGTPVSMPCHPACTLPCIALTIDKVSTSLTGRYWHTIPIQAMACHLIVITVLVEILVMIPKVISQFFQEILEALGVLVSPAYGDAVLGFTESDCFVEQIFI